MSCCQTARNLHRGAAVTLETFGRKNRPPEEQHGATQRPALQQHSGAQLVLQNFTKTPLSSGFQQYDFNSFVLTSHTLSPTAVPTGPGHQGAPLYASWSLQWGWIQIPSGCNGNRERGACLGNCNSAPSQGLPMASPTCTWEQNAGPGDKGSPTRTALTVDTKVPISRYFFTQAGSVHRKLRGHACLYWLPRLILGCRRSENEPSSVEQPCTPTAAHPTRADRLQRLRLAVPPLPRRRVVRSVAGAAAGRPSVGPSAASRAAGLRQRSGCSGHTAVWGVCSSCSSALPLRWLWAFSSVYPILRTQLRTSRSLTR